MIVFALLLACTPASDRPTTVECRGLSHFNLAWRTLHSRLLSSDASTGALISRCEFGLTNQLTGGEVAMGTAPPGGLLDQVDQGWGYLNALGKRWTINEGTMSFDEYDDTLASGTYAFTGILLDEDNNPTEETAAFEGPFSWCEGLRDDCPFRFESSLSGRATVRTPIIGERDGGITQCRMLVEPSTGALQVDLQLGTWEGQNVGQIWVTECGRYGQIPPQNNLFRFRTGGVTGPGAYGPQLTTPYGDLKLPDLRWEHPAAWYPGINQTQACSLFYNVQATATNTMGSECSFVIDREANRFELSCTEIWHDGPGGWPSNFGDFSLQADCEYVER